MQIKFYRLVVKKYFNQFKILRSSEIKLMLKVLKLKKVV